MAYYNLVMPRESVWEILNELGSKNNIQFKDMNENHQLLKSPAIVEYVRRCERMEDQIMKIQANMATFNKRIYR